MLSIDADAHVIETEKTWDYLEGSDRRYRPVPITVDMPFRQDAKFLDHRWTFDRGAGQYRPGHGERVSRNGQHRFAPQTHGRNRHGRSSPLPDAFLATGHGSSKNRAPGLTVLQPLHG